MAEPHTVLPQMNVPWHETTSPDAQVVAGRPVKPGHQTDNGYRPSPMRLLIGAMVGGAAVIALAMAWEINHHRSTGPTPATPAGSAPIAAPGSTSSGAPGVPTAVGGGPAGSATQR